MMPPKAHRNAAQLRDLLATERTAVLSGEYALLEELARRKERLVRSVAANPPPPLLLAKLRAALADNATLMAAASDGFRTAIKNLVAAPPVATALYQADGSCRMMRDVGRQVERKA